MSKSQKTVEINIPAVKFLPIHLHLIGDSPLIVHAWSEKAKREIRDKVQKKAKSAREPKDPIRDGSHTLIWLDENSCVIPAGDDYRTHESGFGLPCRALKASLVRAACDVESVPMTQLKRNVRILPLSPDACVPIMTIDGGKRAMPSCIREDLMRVGGKGPGTGSADLRYRAQFTTWSVWITVELSDVLSVEQVVNLLNRAGATCGVGEDRPEKTGGTGGMFHVNMAE